MSRIKDTFNQTFAEGGKGRQITFWVCIALAAILIVSAFVAIAIKLDKLETFEEVPTSAYARSNILAWKIPWTREPGRLQSMGWQRVGHDRATSTFTFTLDYTF